MKNKGFFITGVGTDVGKTYVSALLYKGLNRFKNTGYYKPIQSGCFIEDDKKISPDVKFVTEFNNLSYDSFMCGITLVPSLSPHIASEIENIEINIPKLIEDSINRFKDFDSLLIEGAGGVYVPIVRDKFYMFDLMKKLDIPVIIVTNTIVGAINNTILTTEFLKSKDIPIHGIIFNNYTGNSFEDDNISLILKDSGVKRHITIKNDDKEIEENILKDFFKEELC